MYFFPSKSGGDGEIPNIHWKNEQRCRKFTKSMSNFIIANETVLTLSFCYSTVCVCIGNYDTTNWVLQFPMKTPFNKEAVIGWYCIWCIQFIQSFSYAICMVTLTTYFVCCCFYIVTLCDHFQELCRLINKDVDQIQKVKNLPNSQNMYQRISKRLYQAIDLHVTTFE